MSNVEGDDLHARVLWRGAQRDELPGVRELPLRSLTPGRHRHLLLHRHLPVQEEPHHRGTNGDAGVR